jgi:hypothetical protein
VIGFGFVKRKVKCDFQSKNETMRFWGGFTESTKRKEQSPASRAIKKEKGNSHKQLSSCPYTDLNRTLDREVLF